MELPAKDENLESKYENLSGCIFGSFFPEAGGEHIGRLVVLVFAHQVPSDADRPIQ